MDALGLRQNRRPLDQEALRPRQRERVAVVRLASRDHPSRAVDTGYRCRSRPRAGIADDQVSVELEEP
jgi:hypothetical protein